MTYEVDCYYDRRECHVEDDENGVPHCRFDRERAEDGLPPLTHKENLSCKQRQPPRDR